MIVTLTALTAEDLMRILIEPKNAVTNQFQKFLSLDKVELVFTPAALKAAAEVALDRKTGARGLRSIVEESLLEVMYDIPERTDVRKCIITEETIRNGRLPLLLTKSDVDKGVDETNYEEWLATAARRRRSAGARAARRPPVLAQRAYVGSASGLLATRASDGSASDLLATGERDDERRSPAASARPANNGSTADAPGASANT